MLDLGFIIPIRQIISRMPKERQSLFFSATMPKEIAGLCRRLFARSRRGKSRGGGCDRRARRAGGLSRRRGCKARPACRIAGAACLSAYHRLRPHEAWRRQGHPASRSRRHSVPRRSTATRAKGNASARSTPFKAGRTKVLVATDIAARGIDVDGVSHVVNFELSRRSGDLCAPDRPGPRGLAAEGIAVSLWRR